MHRLSFGIKIAPSEFNRILSQILKGLQNAESYFDDIIGESRWHEEKIEYLGHIVEYNKLSKSPIKVAAIQDMPRPSNIDDVRRFLGLVTYYSRFVPDFSTISYPLRCLLRKDKRWLWTPNYEETFLKLKAELCGDRVLIPFDPALPLVLTTNASPTGIAAVLSHTIEGFDYVVKCKKGKDNQNLDCLSRASIIQSRPSSDVFIGHEVNQICADTLFHISSSAITAAIIKEKTATDPELVKIMTDLNHIERLVKGCEGCGRTRANPPKVPVNPWDPPQENWERIHLDYAGPYENYFYLVVVDAKSKWAETKISKDVPSSFSTIYLLEIIFASHGYLEVIVSDNASIFQSEEFSTYCTENGIFQKFIAPEHPATNGLAERNVQTLKNRLKSAANGTCPIKEKIQKILFRYRATPLACGKSPAEMYLHRKMIIRLDAIFPYTPQTSKISSNSGRSYEVGERTQVRLYINNTKV
nr:uncharacterized protein LOC106688283 [Halyomorpha halys]